MEDGVKISGLGEAGQRLENLPLSGLIRACQPTPLLLIVLLAGARFASSQPLPRISDNGIVNAASLVQGPVAPNTIVAIFGSNFNLAGGTHAGAASATALPLPTSLGVTQVIMNGIAAPLYYADSTQINAQVPWEVNGATSLSVTVMVNGVPSNLATTPLAVQTPGIFVVAHASSGTAVTPANPALQGEYLTIYCAGLGPVTSPPATGAAAEASPPSATPVNPAVTIGGVAASVVFSGLTPGLAGLYQVNAQVPANVPGGSDVVVVLSIGGADSNTVVTAVQPVIASPVQVSVSPSSAAVLAGATQQFTATVTGTGNSSLTWSVNGLPGGNSTVGTISASGLYTAAGSAPNPNLVFVAATPATNPSTAGTATVAVSAPAAAPSPLGRFRSAGPGLYTPFEDRGIPTDYWPGDAIREWNTVDPVVGTTVAQEISLQLDKMQGMGVTAITYELRTVDATAVYTDPFVPPACPMPLIWGFEWPQPTSLELANLKSFFDLVQSKGMRIRLRLPNNHMEEQPPTNSQNWLGAILGVVGAHPALDLVLFDGAPHVLDSTYGYTPSICGTAGEPPLWFGPSPGPDSVPAQYVEWAIKYAMSLGIPPRKLSAEAVVDASAYAYYSQIPAGPDYTDNHVWNPVVVLKSIFDDLGIPDNQRTYALSFYEQRKCFGYVNAYPCVDADEQTWAELTLQNVFSIIGTGNGARVVAPELGYQSPIDPAWKTEWAMETLVTLLEKYQVEGGSFWHWVNGSSSAESDPTLPDPVKRLGTEFIYNPVEKEVGDWGGFHLTAIPNPSFEGDLGPNGVPSHWTVTGNGTGVAYFLAQEAGQPTVLSRGSYCLRLTTGNGAATVSALSEAIPVTPATAYTTVANLRFSWTGDPNPAGPAASRPQVFANILYFQANGQPSSIRAQDSFSWFQEDGASGFATFPAQYTTPDDSASVQIQFGAVRNGLPTPIVFDVDNIR